MSVHVVIETHLTDWQAIALRAVLGQLEERADGLATDVTPEDLGISHEQARDEQVQLLALLDELIPEPGI